MSSKPRKQAPRARMPVDPAKEARTRRILYAAAAAGIVGLVIVVAFLYFGGAGGATANAARVQDAMESASCTLTTVEAQPPGDHSIASPEDTSDSWNTSPPTNGAHYVESAIFGEYSEPVNQAQLVHNLEHGGVFIQYGSEVPEETVAELRSFYNRNKNGTVLAPLPELGDTIAVGAWVVPDYSKEEAFGYLAKCTAYDEQAFATFLDEFQFNGPERFSPDLLAPGR
jgi:hypothetical protein